MMFVNIKLCIFFLLVAYSTANEEEDDSDEIVLSLDSSSFNDALEQNSFLLVKFYAPWCGHCKALAPKYQEAARILKEEGHNVRLAKVDVTENSDLGKLFDIRGYPTLKFFRSSVSIDYTGGRETNDIVEWIKKKMMPSVHSITTDEELEDFKKDEEQVVVIAHFEDEELKNAYQTVADKLENLKFGAIKGDKVKEVKNGEILMYRKGELSKQFTIENKDDILRLVFAYSLEAVTEFNQEAAGNLFQGIIHDFHFLLISKKHDDYSKILREFEETAEKFRAKIVFVTLDTSLEENARILEFMGIKIEDTPTSRILRFGETGVLRYKPADGQSFVDFSNDFIDEKATLDLKEQPLPEDWDKNPVKQLVASNLFKVVLDEKKAAFVKFYAPWCGHCKQLAPVWEQLAEKFADNENVVIAKIDATLNEFTNISVTSFPLLKFWPMGANKVVVDYSGDRSLKELENFVNSKLKTETDEPKSDSATHEEL
ncbi:unnamed protein product [Caenorhabditis bovis]|uniref:Protein disulfide-isomerase n=1 Tax=Caenorhabditis bovis TaxID=2654633 RepID=A0A8S1EL13_9PELO|nr:unnamed protein product [Caenorhabditis bovis]